MITEQKSEVESSTIKKAYYNFLTKILKIQFTSGAWYEYNNVPENIYEGFCKADSQGKYLNEHIKGIYEFKLLNNE